MHMSAVYLAGRVSWGSHVIGDFGKELEARGHIITCKWWELGRLPQPYLKHPEASKQAAEMMIEAVTESDIFILFAEDDLLGASTEFGFALADTTKPRKILVLLPEDTRQSVFYAYPQVSVVSSIDEIRSEAWY